MLPVDRREWLKMVGLFSVGCAASGAGLGEPVKTPLRLSLNENPFGPAPAVIDAIRAEFPNLCRYSDAGYTNLLAAISTKEGIPQDQIVLGEILEPLGTHLSLQGGSGGEFIYSDPGYTALIDTAAALGGIGIPVPLNSQMQNDLPAIAARVSERTRAVYLVNPHNPTGTVAGADEFKRFVSTVAARALVIVDEAYLEFADSFAQRTLASLVGEGKNVIVFRTFAKAYGLAGLDIGYGLVPKSVAGTLAQQGFNNPHLFNRIALAAAAAGLRESGFLARVVSQVAREREIWQGVLRELNVASTDSKGNFVFFETGLPHADFSAALRKQGIEIGRAFPPYDRWARISIGLARENAIAQAAVRKVLA